MKRGLLIHTCSATLLKCKKNIDVYTTFYTTFVDLYRNYLIIVERRSARVLGECLKRTMRRPKTALPGQIQMKIKKRKFFVWPELCAPPQWLSLALIGWAPPCVLVKVTFKPSIEKVWCKPVASEQFRSPWRWWVIGKGHNHLAFDQRLALNIIKRMGCRRWLSNRLKST